MALPIIEAPEYFLEIPSTGEEIKYRPFLVKEEKILLIAMESENEKEIINAIQSMINSCTFDTLNVSELAMFDLEFIFLQIRGKSKGEILDLKFDCPECKKVNSISINISDVKVEKYTDKEDDHKIDITDSIGIIMKYPSFKLAMDRHTEGTDTDRAFDIVLSCIESIFDHETLYKFSDYTKKEQTDFVDSLNNTIFESIQEFFTNMPKLRKEAKYVCKGKNCKYKEDVVLEGIQNFLG